MADVLSQEAIDALLTTESDGAAESNAAPPPGAHATVTYDFTHPNRVSKDQVRTLENVHSNFAGHLGSALSGMLRAVVDVSLLSVAQLTYAEFVQSLVWPSCTYKVVLDPLEGQCLVDFNPTLSFEFVDRMFGGRGRSIEIERELSGIERNVMNIIATRALKELAHGWSRIIDVTGEIQGFESTPQFIQVVAPGETVIVATLQVEMLSKSGVLTLCYPYLTLEPVMEQLSGQSGWYDESRRKSNEEARRTVESGLREVKADVTAILANSQISMREFLDAREGDVIIADTRVTEPARILVGGEEKFIARPGTRGKYRAVEIISTVAGEDGK